MRRIEERAASSGELLARTLFNREGVGVIGATITAVILLLIYNTVTRRKGAGTDEAGANGRCGSTPRHDVTL